MRRTVQMELRYFNVGKDYGWDQEKFADPIMNRGGCAAVTACDSCIYFSRYFGFTELYPFEAGDVSMEDYTRFADIMKSYLHPRWQGIDTLDIYMDGLTKYFNDAGSDRVRLRGFSGHESYDRAKKVLTDRINMSVPVPCLTLMHKDSRFKDFNWHWFMLTGYKTSPQKADGSSSLMVKAVSYGEWQWLDFGALWETGYRRRGGLILFDLK